MKINTKCFNVFYSGELEIHLSVDIFSISILVLEYKKLYQGYINKIKIESNNNKISPLMVLQYWLINKFGHYDIILIKDHYNIKDYIEPIPKILLGNKYNYHYGY